VPVLKNPKKIQKMLRKLQKVTPQFLLHALRRDFHQVLSFCWCIIAVLQVKRQKRQAEAAGADSKGLNRLQEKVIPISLP
jgi:hypothetical protein